MLPRFVVRSQQGKGSRRMIATARLGRNAQNPRCFWRGDGCPGPLGCLNVEKMTSPPFICPVPRVQSKSMSRSSTRCTEGEMLRHRVRLHLNGCYVGTRLSINITHAGMRQLYVFSSTCNHVDSGIRKDQILIGTWSRLRAKHPGIY